MCFPLSLEPGSDKQAPKIRQISFIYRFLSFTYDFGLEISFVYPFLCHTDFFTIEISLVEQFLWITDLFIFIYLVIYLFYFCLAISLM